MYLLVQVSHTPVHTHTTIQKCVNVQRHDYKHTYVTYESHIQQQIKNLRTKFTIILSFRKYKYLQWNNKNNIIRYQTEIKSKRIMCIVLKTITLEHSLRRLIARQLDNIFLRTRKVIVDMVPQEQMLLSSQILTWNQYKQSNLVQSRETRKEMRDNRITLFLLKTNHRRLPRLLSICQHEETTTFTNPPIVSISLIVNH